MTRDATIQILHCYAPLNTSHMYVCGIAAYSLYF